MSDARTDASENAGDSQDAALHDGCAAADACDRRGDDACGAAPALEARDLTLSWDGGATTVVEGFCLSVAVGQTVCLVGRSGCGKTTVLHALAGLVPPVSGSVLVGGADVTGTPGHVSYMLQKDLLIPSKRVIDNAALPLVISGAPRREARSRASELFERFGLSGTERLWPSQLSGGMRQRVAFLRTYLMGNQVVLLDEPFSALDAITRAEMRSWYCDMARELGLATVVITHDPDEALEMASRVYVLAGAPSKGIPSRIAGEVDVLSGEERSACRERIIELLEP